MDEREKGWFDEAMHAETWLAMPDVKPEDAAMLLCGLNPIRKEDPETVFVDGDCSSPERYQAMLKVFEANKSALPCQLRDWKEIAERSHISVHPWVDRYIQLANLPTRGKKVSKRPSRQQPFQEDEILRVIREMGHDPEAIPNYKKTPGRPSIKSKVREQFATAQWNQGTVFDKAWQRLRDGEKIKDAPE